MHETELTHGKAIQTFLSQANQVLVLLDQRSPNFSCKDRDAAHKKFHALMVDQSLLSAEIATLYELSQTYLDWCEKNRKKGMELLLAIRLVCLG